MRLDKWQQDFRTHKGDKILCTGRQVGKTMICGRDAADFALKNRNTTTLMIAPTERQAYELFTEMINYIYEKNRTMIKSGKDRPTKKECKLKNGSRIMCLPVGASGQGIRGYTIHRLYVDEAARMPEEVWSAVTPMLLTTGGDMILISTPKGTGNYFHDVWKNKEQAFNSFRRFSIYSEKVLKERPICATWTSLQREKGLELIKREKKRMTKNQFAQEYIGEFVDNILQFFPDKLIHEVQTLSRSISSIGTVVISISSCFLGVDVARLGSDYTTFEIIQKKDQDHLKQVESITKEDNRITDTARDIIELNRKYNFKKIYVDDGGLGVGVFDILLEHTETKRKVVGINNARRSIEYDPEKPKQKKLMKEDLYNNLKVLMEQGRIQLLDDPEIFQSLKSVQFEFMEGNKVHIFGEDTHICEGLIRAAWCTKDKSLKLWVR